MDGIMNRSFEVGVELAGMTARVRPVGEIDIETGPLVEERVARLVADGVRRVELDLSGVSFIDSAGLQMLIHIRAVLLAASGALEIVDPSASVARLLQISGMQAVLDGSRPLL